MKVKRLLTLKVLESIMNSCTQEHKKEMIQLKERLTSIEKQLPDIEGETGEEEIDDEESSDSHSGGETFQKIDGKFKKIYNKLIDRMWYQISQLMQQLLWSSGSICKLTVIFGRMQQTIMVAPFCITRCKMGTCLWFRLYVMSG